nr:retrotransposon protein, putative, unclassified [Tanacetum cinerariifolium]
MRVEENLHVNFLENKHNVVGKGHAWMFDLDYVTNSMNYEPVLVENQANKSAGLKEANNNADTHANDDQGLNLEEIDLHEEHFVLPLCTPISTAGSSRAFNDGEPSYLDDPSMPHLEDIYASPNLPFGKKAIGTKWVYKNKKNEMGVVVRNKSAFLYGTIDEEVYVTQPPSFVDSKFPNKV